MADQRIQSNEKTTGANHATEPDTLNRLALVGHNNDGTHKAPLGNFLVDHNNDGSHKKPSFSAHRNGVAQMGLITGTWTKLQCNVEEFDTAGAYDSVTNFRFQPLVAGRYQINAAIVFTSPVTATAMQASIYKNGAAYKTKIFTANGTADQTVDVSGIVNMNGTTDFIEIYVYHASGVNKDINGTPYYTYFDGNRMD